MIRRSTPESQARRRSRQQPAVFLGPVLVWILSTISSGLAPATSWAAGPVYWDFPEGVAFSTLDLRGVGLDRYGQLKAGLGSEVLLAGTPEVFWKLVADGRGGFFGGSGHGGQVWRVNRDGEAELFATLPEPELFDLLLRDGDLFACGGPDGLVFRLPADGEPEVWADLPEGYVWAMANAPGGDLFLAAGSPASVYRVTGRLEFERLAVLASANALALVVTDDGRLLIGTQGPGLIYRLDPGGDEGPEVLFEAPQDEVRQITKGPDNDWYCLAMSRQTDVENPSGPDAGNPNGSLAVGQPPPGPNGNGRSEAPEPSALYRLLAQGGVRQVWGGSAKLLTVAHSPNHGWLGAGVQDQKKSKATLLALEPPRSARPVATWDGGDVLDLWVQADDDREEILAGQAHPGRIVRFTDRSSEAAEAVCEPLDGGVPIHWGRLRWEGIVPKSAHLEWSVRGGQRSVPDETWTEWSSTWTESDHAIPLPPTRFLQWRVQISGQQDDLRVTSVTVSGFEPNTPPTILQFRAESEGEMNIGGLLSREENVTETFPSGLRAEYSITSRADRDAGLFRAAPARPLRTFMWLATDPNGDRLSFRMFYRRLEEESWRPMGPETTEKVGSWDTSSVPDGRYVVRLVASDRLDNPAGEALITEAVSSPLKVDHTSPEISKFQVRRTESGFALSFRAKDAGSPLAEAWLELPDGARERLDPADRICDSQEEAFTAEVEFPRTGTVAEPVEPWRVRVEVADRLGNVAAEEGEVR